MFSDAMSNETANADNSLSRYKHSVVYNTLFDLSPHIEHTELTTLLIIAGPTIILLDLRSLCL